MKMGRILYLVDKTEYVESNCFQRQLLAAFRYYTDIEILPIYPQVIFSLKKNFYRPTDYDGIVSVLRLRTLYHRWPELKAWLKGQPITIYDQDPWEGFIDTSPTKGVYNILRNELNLKAVFVTADWWARKLRQNGIPAFFARMGMEPRWCDHGPDFKERAVRLGFKGSVHAHRAEIFDRMKRVGVKVDINATRLDYPAYMDYLHTLKIFTHDESAPWICDGEPINRSTGMWVKSIETASRGTFVLRNFHAEGETYGISDVPLIQCYTEPEQAAEIIANIERMDPEERRDIQIKSVENIRKRYDWIETAQLIANSACA